MNVINFFKYLESRTGRPIPLEFKLRRDLPVDEKDILVVKGELVISDSHILVLPDNLTVEGDLFLCTSGMKKTPKGLKVGGDLYIQYSEIEELQPDLQVTGGVIYFSTPLATQYSPTQLKKLCPGVKGRFKRYDD